MTESPGTLLSGAAPGPLHPRAHGPSGSGPFWNRRLGALRRTSAPRARGPARPAARWPGGLLALWLCAALVPAHAAIRAALDNARIGAGETVQLTLTYDGITTSEPDLSPLGRDFDILGTSTSTSVQIGTGGSSESTEVVLTLSPKRTGQLTIPSISWDGERSSPLSLTVVGPGAPPASGAPGATPAPSARVFIETQATPAHPYVQAAVRVTVRIYTSEQLYHGNLDFSGSNAALVREIGSDTYRSTVRNGQSYQVITRHYLLFPMRSGKLSLPGPELDAEVATRSSPSWNPFGSFFGGLVQATRPIRVYGNPITLSVRSRPAAATGSYWLPAQNMTLTAQWQSGSQAQAGNPLTVALDLQAVGLTAAQLPDLTTLLHLPAALKAYPDQARLHDTVQGNMLVGSRDQTIALIADRPGHYTVPGITVRWWDTGDNQARTAVLPPQTLTILPASGGLTASAAASPAPRPPPSLARNSPPTAPAASRSAAKAAASGAAARWEWISAGFATLWLATLGGWLWSRRRGRPRAAPARVRSAPQSVPPDPSRARAAFQNACANDDALGARRHLLAWAQGTWGSAPAGLNALAAEFGETATANLLRELDRACYGGSGWRGRPLAAALTELPPRARAPSRERGGLAPLYP